MILVTRPGEAGEKLCQLIEAYGGHAYHFPTLQFELLALGDDAFSLVPQQDYLVFTSPRAVTASIHRIKGNLNPKTAIAAVGLSTAKALTSGGLTVSLVPAKRFGSEELLALFTDIKNKKVMIVRGEGGRDLLEKECHDRGAIVTHCVVYRRVMPQCQVKPAIDDCQVVMTASYEGVSNLKKMMTNDWGRLQKIPLVVVSQRIKVLAENLGFQTIWVADNASHPAMLALLVQRGMLYDRRNHD